MKAHEAATTHYCKFPNCPNEARSPVGRYAYCDEHQNRQDRGIAPQQDRGIAPPPSNGAPANSLAATIAALAKDAKAVDSARAKAAKLADKAVAAKRHADRLQAALETKMREVGGRA